MHSPSDWSASVTPGSNKDRGDEQLRRIYDDNLVAVYRYVRGRVIPSAVDDVVQEIFVAAWKALDRMPAGRHETLLWLFGVARRVVANHHRVQFRQWRLRARIIMQPGVETRDSPSNTGDPELDLAIARLSPSELEVLRLVYWDELSIAEAATVLGCSANAAAVRLHRLRRKLLRQLCPCDGPVVDTLRKQPFSNGVSAPDEP